MKKLITMELEDYEKEKEELKKQSEEFGALRALDTAVVILRHDFSIEDMNTAIYENKYFRKGQCGNPFLSLISIGKFYKMIVKMAEEEQPEFFKRVIEKVNEDKKWKY